jgi:hypothetical protein
MNIRVTQKPVEGKEKDAVVPDILSLCGISQGIL